MDTDRLERRRNRLCHEWMRGKPPAEGVFDPVQASARVFIFQALAAWAVLEQTGQTGQLAPDFGAWLEKILHDEIPHIRRVSRVRVTLPKH